MDFLVSRSASYLLNNKDILLTPFINICSLYLPERSETVNKLKNDEIIDFDLIKELFMFYSQKSYEVIRKGMTNKTKLVVYIIDQKDVDKTSALMSIVLKELALEYGVKDIK